VLVVGMTLKAWIQRSPATVQLSVPLVHTLTAIYLLAGKTPQSLFGEF
jgi:hypothetical protein